MDERLVVVRELWSTYRERGVGAAILLLDPEVEFVDHTRARLPRPRRRPPLLREFEERGESFMASPYTFELHKPDLIVIGHRRIRSAEGLRGECRFFVHSCRDGRVSRIAAHVTKEDALADVASRD